MGEIYDPVPHQRARLSVYRSYMKSSPSNDHSPLKAPYARVSQSVSLCGRNIEAINGGADRPAPAAKAKEGRGSQHQTKSLAI